MSATEASRFDPSYFDRRARRLRRSASLFISAAVLMTLVLGWLLVFGPSVLLARDSLKIDAEFTMLNENSHELRQLVREFDDLADEELASLSQRLSELVPPVEGQAGWRVDVSRTGSAVGFELQFVVSPTYWNEPEGTTTEFLGRSITKSIIPVDSEREKERTVLERSAVKALQQDPISRNLAHRHIELLRDREDFVGFLKHTQKAINSRVDAMRKEGAFKSPEQLSIQTSVTRFGSVAVVLVLISLFISAYRYNLRLASFYEARADALRMLSSGFDWSSFVTLVGSLSPEAYDFGKESGEPAKMLADILSKAKLGG